MPSRLKRFLKGLTGDESEEKAAATKKAEKKPAKKAAKAKKPAAKKATKKTVKKAAKTTAKKGATKATKKAAKKATKKTTRKSAKAAKKATKKSPQAPVKSKAADAVKSARKAAKKKAPAKKAAKKKAKQHNWAKQDLEPLTTTDFREQEWVAERSKIKAAIEKGLPDSYFRTERMLYIGAAHGYTIAHLHEKPLELYAVEKSPQMMRHFLPLAEDLPSVLPILGDAAHADSYAHYLPQKVDVLFQDIAQKDQVGIFLANCDRFLSPSGVGMLSFKAPAVSSTAEPQALFADARRKLEENGATIVQEINLEPEHTAHRLFVVHLNPYMDW